MDVNKLSTSNIDLSITLDAHGWSTGRIFIEHEILECSITHIFNDPYYDTMDALLPLVKGYDSSFV